MACHILSSTAIEGASQLLAFDLLNLCSLDILIAKDHIVYEIITNKFYKENDLEKDANQILTSFSTLVAQKKIEMTKTKLCELFDLWFDELGFLYLGKGIQRAKLS